MNKPQRIQLDNSIPNDENLDYKDVLLYAMLLKYADKNTYKAFPSLERLSQDCKMSRTTVKNRLDKLMKNGNIEISKRYLEKDSDGEVKKKGRSNLYILKRPPKYLKDKEEFTKTFLESDLDPDEKAFILCTQQLFSDKSTGTGTLEKSSVNKLCKVLKCGKTTCASILTTLEDKGIIFQKRDGQKLELSLNLDKIGQAVLFIAEQVSENTEDIMYLKNKVAQLEKEITELRAGNEEGCEVVD